MASKGYAYAHTYGYISYFNSIQKCLHFTHCRLQAFHYFQTNILFNEIILLQCHTNVISYHCWRWMFCCDNTVDRFAIRTLGTLFISLVVSPAEFLLGNFSSDIISKGTPMNPQSRDMASEVAFVEASSNMPFAVLNCNFVPYKASLLMRRTRAESSTSSSAASLASSATSNHKYGPDKSSGQILKCAKPHVPNAFGKRAHSEYNATMALNKVHVYRGGGEAADFHQPSSKILYPLPVRSSNALAFLSETAAELSAEVH